MSELCHSDSESPANILGFIYDEETKRMMKNEDEEEDYLDDSKRKGGEKEHSLLHFQVRPLKC